jgi:ribonuclease HI
MDARTISLLDDALARARALLEPQGFLFGTPRLLDEGTWGRYDIAIDPPDGRASKLQVHVNGKGRTSVVPQGPAATAMRVILEGGSTDAAPPSGGSPAPTMRALPLTRAAREAGGATVGPSSGGPRSAANDGPRSASTPARAADDGSRRPDGGPSTTTGPAGPAVAGASLVVDCSKFGARLIGPTEWRGMQRNAAGGWTEVFRSARHDRGHNNLGEFLAIIEALRRIESGTLAASELFSDSRTAISWVTKGIVKTTLDVDGDCDPGFAALVRDARVWITTPACARLRRIVRLWDTPVVGENPADFGRK